MQNWLFKQGEARGEARGMAHGEANALLRILERRAVPVTDEARSRILACTSTTQLDAWLDHYNHHRPHTAARGGTHARSGGRRAGRR